MTPLDLGPYFTRLAALDPLRSSGVVVGLTGLLVESHGPAAAIGDFCEIQVAGGKRVRTQVIGFREGKLLSIPLEETGGLRLGDTVVARREDARMEVGQGLLGRVLDGFGVESSAGSDRLRSCTVRAPRLCHQWCLGR